jgi:hypothetical protein
VGLESSWGCEFTEKDKDLRMEEGYIELNQTEEPKLVEENGLEEEESNSSSEEANVLALSEEKEDSSSTQPEREEGIKTVLVKTSKSRLRHVKTGALAGAAIVAVPAIALTGGGALIAAGLGASAAVIANAVGASLFVASTGVVTSSMGGLFVGLTVGVVQGTEPKSVTEKVLKMGQVNKLGKRPNVSSWKERTLILTTQSLLYFKDKGKHIRSIR